MPFYVAVAHGDTAEHDGLVSALRDILDSYTDERTGILVWKDQRPPRGARIWYPTDSRRIRGPILARR